MDFSLREWLIILGVIVIVGVLVDGYRRMRRGRRNSIKLAIDKKLCSRFKDRVDYFNGELPSGGARVVGRAPDDAPEDAVSGLEEGDEIVPESLYAEDDLGAEDLTQEELADEEQDDLDLAMDSVVEEEVPSSEQSEVIPAKVEEVIVINVFAKQEEGLNGAEVMHIILACGMRFGEMDIFHRNESEDGSGLLQFSMANAVKPGTFDLDEMNSFCTPGVSFFLSLPGPKDSMKAFDCMLETAKCLVNNLDAELHDEQHSVMTNQTIAHARQKIRDFERRQLSLLG